MNKERLNRRVHGRDQAKLVIGSVDINHPDEIDGFLDELESKYKPKAVEEKRKKAERSFSECASHVLNFGEYRGCKLENIPRDYLEWLLDSSNETVEMLSRYLEETEGDDR